MTLGIYTIYIEMSAIRKNINISHQKFRPIHFHGNRNYYNYVLKYVKSHKYKSITPC